MPRPEEALSQSHMIELFLWPPEMAHHSLALAEWTQVPEATGAPSLGVIGFYLPSGGGK